MHNRFLTLFTSLCLLLNIFNPVKSHAQASIYQRLVIDAIDLTIPALGLSEGIATRCFDADRYAPDDLANYKNVLYGNEKSVVIGNDPPITLQEALNNHSLVWDGNGYKVGKLKNNTGKTVTIHNRQMVIGDMPTDTREVTPSIMGEIKGKDQNTTWDYRTAQHSELLERDVLRYNNFLHTNTPTLDEFNTARNAYKAKYGITNQYEYKSKIEYEGKELEAYRDNKNNRIMVYRREGLLTTDNPTSADLTAAEHRYKTAHQVTSLGGLNDEIINDMQGIYDEELVFYKEGYLTQKNPTSTQLLAAEQAYTTANNISGHELLAKMQKRALEIENDNYHALAMLPGQWLEHTNSTSTGLKVIERELGLPETGDLATSKAMDVLAYYHKTIRPFMDVNKMGSAEDVVKQVKTIKANLGLPESIAVDNQTSELFNKLTGALKTAGIDNQRIVSASIKNKNVYYVTSDYSNLTVYHIDLTAASPLFETIKSNIKNDYYTCYINKLNNNLYLIDNKVATADEVYTAISNNYYYKTYGKIEFNPAMSEQDMQSIIRGNQIKEIASDNAEILNGKAVNAAHYETSLAVVNETPTYGGFETVTVNLKHKSANAAGYGIIGDPIYTLSEVRISKDEVGFSKVKKAINKALAVISGAPDKDFGSELVKDLKDEQIDYYTIKTALTNIEILLINSEQDDTNYFYLTYIDGQSCDNKTETMPGCLLFSAN